MDRSRLVEELSREFDSTERACRAVSRQARDLDDSGQIAADFDSELTVEVVVSNLADAPEEYDLIERWNWWMGALELSHGEYQRFHVRPDIA